MRFLQALTRLQAGLALALLGIALALLPLGLTAVGYELSPRQGYDILVLAALFVVGAVIVLLWPWITEAWLWIRRDAELQQLNTELQASEQERKRLEKELASRGNTGKVWGPTITQEDSSAVIARLTSERDQLQKELESRKADAGVRGEFAYDQKEKVRALRGENEQLRAEIDALKEERHQNLQEHRRKRIEEWRDVIRNFDFEAEQFGATDTYSQMRKHLQGQIAYMFEGNSSAHTVNEARGHDVVRYELLDEVARIEKEWGLV